MQHHPLAEGIVRPAPAGEDTYSQPGPAGEEFQADRQGRIGDLLVAQRGHDRPADTGNEPGNGEPDEFRAQVGGASHGLILTYATGSVGVASTRMDPAMVRFSAPLGGSQPTAKTRAGPISRSPAPRQACRHESQSKHRCPCRKVERNPSQDRDLGLARLRGDRRRPWRDDRNQNPDRRRGRGR